MNVTRTLFSKYLHAKDKQTFRLMPHIVDGLSNKSARGRYGVNAAGIYVLRLLKAGCASSAVGSLRPLCDGFRVWLFHIDKISSP